MRGNRTSVYFVLVGANLIYSFTSFFTKTASSYKFLSPKYNLCIFAAITIMFIYALLWQQIIKKIPISDAYMFKGLAVIFTLCISVLFFNETISLTNIIGASLIVFGIAFFAKA